MIMEAHTTDLNDRDHLEFIAALANTMPEAVMITTAEEGPYHPVILHVNPAFTDLTGYSPEDIVGATPSILQGPRTDRKVLNRLKLDLANRDWFKGSTFNYRKDGTEFIMDWEIVPFHDSDGSDRFYLTVQREGQA